MAPRKNLQQYSLAAKKAKAKGKKVVTTSSSEEFEEIGSEDSSNTATPPVQEEVSKPKAKRFLRSASSTKKKIKLGSSADHPVFPVPQMSTQVHENTPQLPISSETKVDEAVDDVWEKAAKQLYACENVDNDDGTWKPWSVHDTSLIFVEHTASILEQAAAKAKAPATDEKKADQVEEQAATEQVAAEQDVGQAAAAEQDDTTVADTSFPSSTKP